MNEDLVKKSNDLFLLARLNLLKEESQKTSVYLAELNAFLEQKNMRLYLVNNNVEVTAAVNDLREHLRLNTKIFDDIISISYCHELENKQT